MAVLPALFITVLVISQDLSFTHFIPISPNDQNEYWHQIATFNAVGFNGGYYTHLEQTAPIPQSKFGVHGPFYIVLVGLLSRVTGWNYATPIFYNMVFLALGFVIFASLCKLNHTQILLAGLSLSAFAPVLLYLPTALQESFHQVVGIIFAAIFAIALFHQEELDFWKKAVMVLFTLLVSIIRPSWGFLFFPLFALLLKKDIKSQAFAFFISFFLFFGVIFFDRLFITPGNNTFSKAMDLLVVNFRSGMKFLLTTILDNLQIYVSTASIPQMVFRLEYILILLLALVWIIYLLRKKKRSMTQILEDVDLRLGILIFLIILPILLLSFSMYFMKNDMRFIAPYFILIIFLLVSHTKYNLVLVFVVINLLILPLSISLTNGFINSNFRYSEEEIMATRQVIDQHIRFDPGRTNDWCNTILMSVTLYDERISQVPPGIGISYVMDNTGVEKFTFPVKSRYVWLTDEVADGLNQMEINQLTYLAGLSDSHLYLNKNSACISE